MPTGQAGIAPGRENPSWEAPGVCRAPRAAVPRRARRRGLKRGHAGPSLCTNFEGALWRVDREARSEQKYDSRTAERARAERRHARGLDATARWCASNPRAMFASKTARALNCTPYFLPNSASRWVPRVAACQKSTWARQAEHTDLLMERHFRVCRNDNLLERGSNPLRRRLQRRAPWVPSSAVSRVPRRAMASSIVGSASAKESRR